MRKPIMLVLPLVLLLGASFTLHIPIYQSWDEPRADALSLTLQVIPEQAKILVDGTFMGLGYEFKRDDHPLKLNRSARQMTVRMDGFREQVIDLAEIEENPARLDIRLEPLAASPESTKAVERPVVATEYRRPVGSDPKEQMEESEAAPADDAREEHIGILNLKVDPRGASLYLDKVFWGTAPQDGSAFPVRMKAGVHRLDILAPGHDPLTRQITLNAGEEQSLELHLVPSPRKPGTEKEE